MAGEQDNDADGTSDGTSDGAEHGGAEHGGAEHGGPWRRVPWTSVVAVLAAVGGMVLALVANRPAATRAAAVPLPLPRSVTSHGTVYPVVVIRPSGAQRDARDPRAVRVFAMQAENSASPRCNQLSPSARVLRETGTRVVVATYAYRLHTTGTVYCAFTASSAEPLFAPLTLRLRHPLGSRTLVDAGTGRPIGFPPAVPPTPSVLPPAYAAEPFASGPGFDPNPTRVYTHGTTGLEVSVSASPAASAAGRVAGTALVAGHAASVTEGDGERCVGWSAGTGLRTEVCSVGRPGQLLSAGELLRVARGLR